MSPAEISNSSEFWAREQKCVGLEGPLWGLWGWALVGTPPPGSKCKLVSWVGRVLRATCGLLEPQDEAALWAGVASGDRKWVGYLWDSASHPPGLSL